MAKKKMNTIFIPEDPPRKPSLLPIAILLFVAPPISTLVALYLAFQRGRNELTRRQYRNYRQYAAMIGARSSVSIREMASRMGKATADVISDLQSMIDKGFITGNAYIDRSSMMFYMDDEAVETEFVSPTVNVYVDVDTEAQAKGASAVSQNAGIVVETAPRTEEPRQPRHAQAGEAHRTGTDNADFENKLREIRHLNDEIDDGPVSERIDRIGELTASIFRVVREKPEHAEEVRKFMNYYLPTTLKLLKSYSLMEKQSYQGENIQASRKKIEEVLDTLIHAFEQQQDRLFQSEALDVETDISVLETMMASDGFIENKNLHMRASGSGEN